jgi:hypothetical protein
VDEVVRGKILGEVSVSKPLTAAELFYLSHGPNFSDHPAFQGAYPPRGTLGWDIAVLCDKFKKNPLLGIRLWQRVREDWIGFSAVRSWYAFKFFEVDEDPANEWVKTILDETK